MKNTTLKFTILFLFAILLNSNFAFSQSVAINDDGALPNSNAILDISSSLSIKGLLIPRVSTADRTGTFDDSFAATETGLTVYDTDNNTFFYWNGSAWSELTTQGANWSVTGNTAIDPNVNFIGTTDDQPLIFKTGVAGDERARFLSDGRLGINTIAPDVYFHIYGDDTDEGINDPDDATYSNGTGLFVLGDMTGRNLVLDQNEIMARNNGAMSSLYLQNRGGNIFIHYDVDNLNHDTEKELIITEDGDFGIGTLSPQERLHIMSTEATDAAIVLETDEGDDPTDTWLMRAYASDNDLIFRNNNVARVTIEALGNVGIGTVSPEGILHIKANAGNNATFLIDADAGTDATDTWKLQSDATSNNLHFMNDVNTFMSIKSGGNVGIGTVLPEEKLHIKANAGNDATFVIDADAGTDATDTWKISSVAVNNNLDFINDASIFMSVESGGNVGIGTDNPDAKLHVLTNGTVMGQYPGTIAAFQQNAAAGDWARISIVGGNLGASIIDFADADIQNTGTLKFDHTDNFLSYSYYDGTTETEILRIEDYGYVGIGKTNPSEKLDVDGAVLLGTTTNSNAGAIRWNGSSFQGYDGSNWVSLSASGGNWTLSGSDIYRNTGNVGIGTTIPNEKLEVNGSIRMTDGNEGVGKIMVSDANGTASWGSLSSTIQTNLIRTINQGAAVVVTLWSHPAGIDVTFDPATEIVTVVNATGDAVDYWDIIIEGDASASSGTTGADQYIKHYRKNGESLYLDLGTIDSGWFRIIASDQNDEQDGFIMNVVYYGDDFNGTVQYWDN